MLEDSGLKQDGAFEIWCDSKSAIEIAKNLAHHGRTNHIDICFHFIQSLVDDGIIVLNYCKTKELKADILTKALPMKKHNYQRMLIGVEELSSNGGC